jgi:hypothetical protein
MDAVVNVSACICPIKPAPSTPILIILAPPQMPPAVHVATCEFLTESMGGIDCQLKC